MTKEQIHQLFKQGYNQADWKIFLGETFSTAKLLVTPKILTGIDTNVASKALRLGLVPLDENGIERQIAVYEVELAKGIILERNRVGLRNLLRKFWKNIDAAFIVYHNPDSPASAGNGKWRFTYVSELTGYNAEGEFIKINTEPKRYTYVLGEGESTRTAAERFNIIARKGSHATLEDVKEAFSVEKMSKEFFDEYKKQYAIFCDFMMGEPGIKSAIFKGDEKAIRDFNKKLLGRIVFLYFLQKKGWMGVPVGSKWGQGDFNFLRSLFERCENRDLFYTETLTTLFFDTLNAQRENDIIELIKGQPYRIPYLNGGLFELENPKYKNIFLPGELFENLFHFFSQYNFTIYEDDPNDKTVAVDPEMLGHIFENLLEDNKDKGAYYTPKEIVQYMCQESFIEYLSTWFEKKGYEVTNYTSLGKEQSPELFPINDGRKGQLEFESPASGKKIDRSLIEKLLKKQLEDSDKKLIKKHATEFHQALDSVKICDPAIGSGAFPMGLLQEIFTTKQTLWYFEHGNLKDFPASEVKLNIIQNSIYGVDIEKGAVDIARLRFWLSLVVDEEEPKALPNLDYKIVVGNSLVSKFDGEIVEIDWNRRHGLGKVEDYNLKIKRLLNDITEKQKKYFNPNQTNKKAVESEIRNLKIELLISQISLNKAVYINKEEQKGGLIPSAADIKHNTERTLQIKLFDNLINKLKNFQQKTNIPFNHFDWKLDFPEVLNELINPNPGFDIMIGNPPYLRIQGIRKVDSKFADGLEKRYQSSTGSFDLYVLFAEKGLQLTKSHGILNFIMPVKWVNAAFGKGLRALLQGQNAAYKIISFEAFQVFNASTYTGLQWFRRNSKFLNYFQLDRDLPDNTALGNFLNQLNKNSFNMYPQNSLHDNAWTLTDNLTDKILQKIRQQPVKVKDVFKKFFTGLQTSKDSVYFIMNSQINGATIIGFSKELNRQVTIEAGLVKPLLKGDQVHRYQNLQTNNYVIFPYKLENGKAVLYSETEIKKRFPLGYTYLKENEKVLRGRENDRLINDDSWFRYIYPKNLTLFDKPKLICPDICLGGNYAHDKRGEFYDTTTLYGYIKNESIEISYEYFLGLLNSNLVWYFLRNTGTVLANNYFRFMPRYVNEIPIYQPTKFQEQKIFTLVKVIYEQKSRNKDTAVLEHQIDNLVYRLYGLTYEEVKVIDPEFTLSKAEYEAIEVE